jgi:hypothetical protein
MSYKSEMTLRIKRRFGYPMIKVELDDTQIIDHIDYSRHKFIMWASGHATDEVYFTVMLSAGQYLYDMPEGTVDVLSYDANANMGLGSINTLFTLGNYMYSQGAFGFLQPGVTIGGFNLINYHVAIDFLETLSRYNPSQFLFRYHRYANQIELQPPPPSGNALQVGDMVYDSPGFVLIKAAMIEGSTLPGYSTDSDDDCILLSQWVEEYAFARCMHTLGLIRRKFANFTALGNAGASLDGDSLVQEANTMMEDLLVKLRDQENYKGMGIIVG